MLTCGRTFLGSLKTLAFLTLSAVTAISSTVRAGAQTTQTPSSYSFGNVAVNETSRIERITVKNTQAGSIAINSYGVTGGPYSISTVNSTCANPGSLGAGASCFIAVTVAPTALGAVSTGTLTLNTTATNSPQQVTLNATAVNPVALSAMQLTFNSTAVGSTSNTLVVALANNQNSSVTVTNVSVTTANGYALTPATQCSGTAPQTVLTAYSSCTISVNVSPNVVGAVPASSLSATTTASGTPIAIPLNETGLAPTTLSPALVAFGNEVVGQTSLIRNATLTNEEKSAITIDSIVAPAGGFAIDPSTTCANDSFPGTLGAGASCTIGLTYTPTALGAAPAGSVTITTSASNSPQLIAVTGTGIAAMTLTPSALGFGLQAVGQTSSIHTLTLYNNQSTASVSISSIAINGDSQFAVDPSTTCSTSLGPGATCKIAVTFTPTANGSQPIGTLMIADNAPNSPETGTLTGAGGSATSLTPSSIAFGGQVISTTSATKTLTLKNLQSSALTISSLVFSGPFQLDTSATTTCPMSGGTVNGTLAANSSCVIGVQFAPTAQGATSGGQITVLDNAPNGPVLASLSGSGIRAVGLSTPALNFGAVAVNTTSAPKNITVYNQQSSNLDFVSISAPAPYSIYPGTTTCVTTAPVLPGKSCVISVTLTPTAVGAIPLSAVTITDDAASSPQTVSVSGSGVPQVAVSPNPVGFGVEVVNEQSTRTTTLTNYLGTAISINSIGSFTGGYTLDTTATTCPLAPVTVAAGTTCMIGIDITPTATGSQPGTGNVNYNVVGNPTAVNLPFTTQGTAYQPVVISPVAVDFSTQFVGVQSPATTVTIKNEQSVPLNISSITVAGTNPGDFSIVSNLCPTVPTALAAGLSCKLTVAFTPTASGRRIATLTVADDALGSPQTISIYGDANAPVLVTPKSITNFNARVSQVSAYQTITITNELSTSLTNINFQISGDFEQTSTTCGATAPYTLAGGAACKLTISMSPTVGGTRTGQLQVTDSAYTSPQVVNLQGTGTNPLVLSSSSLNFAAQLVNTTSAAKVITLTNNETKSESFSLTPSGPFSGVTNCTTGTIAANSSCNIYVSFSPATTTPPSQSGSVTVTDSAAGGSPLVLSLVGAASATNPAPAVAVLTPGAAAGGAAATIVNVAIFGNGWTHFSPSSVITFPVTSNAYASDITVNSFAANGPNIINASITLAASPVFGARNIKVVTPLSAGGFETATLNSAFIISDPTQTFEITSITPGVGTQGQGYLGVAPLTVNITATGTSFVQGTTYANFGDGVSVESLTINSSTTATAVLAISNTTTVGYRTVTMVTGGQVANSVLNNGNPLFYVGPNSAKLTSVTLATVSGGIVTCTSTPASEPQSFAGPVCLTATGTHFLQNATGVTVTGGVTVGDTIVTSPTTAYFNVIVPAGATIGVDNVTVATGGEIATLPNSFTVTGSTPALVSVVPASAQQGQSTNVVITGNSFTAFNACPGGVLTADFTGVISTGSIVINSAHQVTVPISVNENAPTGGITARLTCGGAGQATIFPFGFTIAPSSASIVSVTPSSVPQGGQVTLTVTGLNTDWSQADTVAQFYPTPIATPHVDETTINSATSAMLNISVPTNTPVGTYCFYMATGGQIVSACIQVYANTPTLTMNPANGLLPTSGTNSFNVSFTGQFTHFSQTNTLPVIAGEGVTLTNFTVNNLVSATGTINIAAGAATGSRLVTFTTGGEIVTTYFNVTTIPVGIVSVSPWHGPQSQTMNVQIVGLNTHFTSTGPNPSQVIFGGPQITVNSITVNSATDLIANITTSYTPPAGSLTPTPPGWNAVYINTGSEQLITGFLVDAPATPSLVSACVTADLPSCVSSAPQGSGGTDVTITGSLTNWNGSSELIMGAGITVANLVIVNPTTATATISVSPTAPVGGNSVIMITPLAAGGYEYDSGVGFSVTPSAAYISDVALPACANSIDVTFIANFCNNGTSNIVPVISQLQTSMLNITGTGTHWLQGETTFSFGSGVVLDQTTIIDPTHATVQITVLSSSPVGFATATAFTDGENASLVQAIDIEEGSPTFLAFSPQGAEQGATLNVEVLGRFTNWSATTPPVAEFNQDITINTLTVVDSETLVLNVTVSPWAYVDYGSPCGHVLTITSGSEQVSSSQIDDNFCVSTGAQEITNVSPNASGQGSSLQVTITGSQTNFLNGQTQVSFGDPGITVGVPAVQSLTSLTVPILVTTTATPGFHTVTVTTYGQVATQVDAFTAAPTVAQLTEAISNQAEQGVQGLTVRLIGQYTHFSTASTATFGPGIVVVGNPTWVSDTEIDATINIDPVSYVGGRTVTVTTPGISCADQPPPGINIQGVTYQGCTPGSSAGTGSEIVDASVFSIIQGPAIISNVSPNTGNEGQEVVFTITGSATHWAQNFTQFYIAGGGSDITVNDVIISNPTTATVDITISQTANPGARSIYMVTAGESLTDAGAFVVTGGVPAVSYITPGSAQPGTTELQVTVVGNPYTQWVQGTTTVNFGPGITIDSQEVTDASHIVADINIGATCTAPNTPVGCAQYGYRTVVVQTGTQGLTGSFNVVAPPPPPTPYVWYETPSTGIPGQTVSVYFYGANTEWVPGNTTLTGWDANNITVNTYQIVSATEAIANITINSSASQSESMALTFTTNGTTYNDGCVGCEVDNASFNIVIAQPTLTIVDPGSGLQGAQNITVNILGQFTAFDGTTTFSFGGPGSGITTVGAPTILGPTIATQMISIDQEANTGGYAVVANTPDAPANAKVVGGAGFSVTPSLATILTVAPNTTPQGTEISVTLTGEDTHWSPATTFSFGAGIVVTSVDVTSETSANLTLAIPAYAPEGTTYAQARTSGEVATLNQAFVITAGTPYLLSSGPGSVEQQGSAVFTILAQATNWSSATPPVVSYGGDIALGPVTVTSPTTITIDGAVSPTAYPGYRNLTVTTGTQVLSINNAVYIAPGPAVINSVTPNTGGQGVTFSNVQINGINTHWVQGITTLTFPGVLVNSYTVNSFTSITANITVNLTATPGQVNVTATTLGEVATEVNAFTITQTQAELAFIDPPSLPQGQTQNLTITGIDTTFTGSTVVSSTSAGVAVNSVTFNSATSLTANVTVSPTITLGYKNITVTTGAQIVSSNSLFHATIGPAAISGLSPATGGEGQSVQVVVTGSQTHFNSTTSAAFSGGISVTGITVQNQTQATVNIFIPATVPLGTYNVTLTTSGEVATILGGFTVGNGAPVITNVTPPTGTQGITTNVTLTGEFTSWNSTSVANFGSGITVNSTNVTNATTAIANITIMTTATVGSRNVSVATSGQPTASITGGFTVLTGVPALVSASPGTGQAGTTVNLVVTGVFTNFQQAFTTVSLGDGITTNFVTVSNTTQLTANVTIPSNASTVSTYVSVDTNGSTLTLDNAFTVLPGTPFISQINPNVGTTGQTLNVTIVGVYTNWVNGTTAATFVGSGSNITVNSTTVNSATNLTANITIPSLEPLGPVTVTTTTNSEVENVPGGFTIQSATPPSPQVISLSPGADAGGMPLNAVINAVFSEPMLRSTISNTTVLLTLTSNPNGNVAVGGTVSLDPTGRIVTFEPSSLLAPNSTYYFNMTGSIQSATGVALSNYAVDLYTTSATATTGPTVVAFNPPASSTVGTNVTVQLEFSGDMQQDTSSGMTVSTGGTPVAGTYSWNANPYCCGSGWAQPGTVLTFTPTAPLTAGTTYTVAWNSTLIDTAGNAVVPGSFTFTTGSGPDSVTNNAGSDFNGLTNVATNFVPTVTYAKPINPIDIWGGWNSGTLEMWNNDSGKYIEGTVTVAPNGLSATFKPTVPLLPDTYYRVYQAGGAYDADGNTLNGINAYFTTGASTDTTAPTVTFVSPANSATSVPLNSQIMVKFSTPLNENNLSNVLTVTPSGGSAIAGTVSLASDLVTMTFVPSSPLQQNTVYTVAASGFTDIVGNTGTPFTSTFTTAASAVVINLSTGLNASGQVITPVASCGGTSEPTCPADAHWTVVPTGSSEALGLYVATASTTPPASGPSQPLYVAGSGDAGWYSGWPADGPQSDSININPSSGTGNTFGVYSTTFNIPSPVPSNLCLVGSMGVDDNGTLGIVNSANPKGIAITGNVNAIYSFATLNVPISSYLVAGSNTLALGWGSTDNNDEMFRLQAIIETCGASLAPGGLSLTSSTPANNTTNIATNTSITMTFSNPLNPDTVNATTLPVMVGYNSNQELTGNYVVSGNTVTFTPATPFPVSTQIYVGACGGPLDLAGDSAGGCYTELLTFQTGSTATPASGPLQVMAFTPAANATNVGLRSPVTATFNRSINLGSINSGDFGLFAGDGQTPWCGGGSYTHSQDDATVSFNCGALPSSSTMTAVLNSGIEDWQGNALTNFSSQFTTSQYDSNTNGSIITTRPANGASGVNANLPIVLYSNLPINASTANNGIQVAQNNVIDPGSVQVLDNGYTLVFTPSTPFAAGALIQWWTTGSLFETTYNTPINGDSGYFYVAASTSTLAPTVETTSPQNGTSGAALNAIFDTQFNTPLNPSTVNSTNIYIYDSHTGLHVSGTYSMPQPNEVRIVPSAPVSASAYIYVYVTTGLQSTTSVPVTSTTYWYVYTGTTSDTTLPTVLSAVPFNGATNVAVNDSPGVVFNKPIDPVSMNSSTFQVLNGSTPLEGSYWFSSNDTRIEFVPSSPLPQSTTLTMKINGVIDQVGNPVTYSSSFQTGGSPDFTAPTVLWSSVNSQDTVPTNSMIAVQFSESMDATTFTAGGPSGCGNFYIQDQLSGDGIGCIPVTLSWNTNQTVAYLVPSSPLAAGREYLFAVNGGTDLAGNTMSGYSFYFYSEYGLSTVAPTVINFNPIGGKTGLGTNAIIEAQFSAPIDPTTIFGVTLSAGGTTVPTTRVVSTGDTVLQLVPASPLTPGTTYTMNITGVSDPAGNPVAPVNNSFTTGATYDISAASMTVSNPVAGATVGTNTILKMVFNKPLNPITVNNSTFRLHLSDTGQFIPLNVSLSASGLEVTMTPQIPLLPNTYYYFQACCGFQDEDGNNGNGVNVYFYTSGGTDTTGPTVTISPINTATGIPLNAQVVAFSSAPIDPTSWSQTSIEVLNGSTQVPGTVSLTNSTTLTFVPSANLSAGITYTVHAGNFSDSDENPAVPFVSSFTTGTLAGTGGLTLTSYSPGNNSSGNSTTATITMVFNEPLDPATVNASTLKVMYGYNSNQTIAGTYTVTGNTVKFVPTSAYPISTTTPIYVASCGGPTDVIGDVFNSGGCYDQLFYFYVSGTPYTGAFQVMSVSPADGATNVGRDQPVSVTFNNSISQTSLSSYNFQLYAGQSLQDYSSYTLSADNRTLTFNVGALYNATNYTIDLPANGISDQSGNTLANIFTSNFSTVADPATGNGSVTSTAPSTSTSSSVPVNTLLTLYLNRQVDTTTLPGNLTVTVNGQVYAGTVQADASGYQVQFLPAVQFPNSATVQWFFSGNVLDVYGDNFNGASGYFYTVAAVNAATAQPTIVTESPTCCNSQLMPTNGEVDIQYSQPIDASTVTNANIFQETGPAIGYNVSLVTPTVVRIAPTTPFNASTQYGFCASANVKGTNGVAAQSACYLTYFTTTTGTNTTGGTVTVGPPNGSQNVGTNAYIRLNFSEPADRTTVNSTNVQVTIGGTAIPGSFTYNYSGADLVGADFYPLNPLPTGATVKVAVSSILDYAGNEFSEPTITFTTAAQPDYTTPTATLDFSSGQTGVATNASFNCHYSEPMDPSSITSADTFVWSYVNNAAAPATISVTTDMMTATITPTAPLFANTEYYYACYSAIDLTGNAMSNVNAYFYTGAGTVTTGPTLVYANPPNGMTNVPVDTNQGPWNSSSLNLLFSEPVATESLGNITLTPQGGSAIPIAAIPEDGNYIVSIALPYALSPNTVYTYNVTGVTDLAGNLAVPATSTFTTGSSFDFSNAGVTATTPANGVTTTGVPTSVTVTFSEALDPVLINTNVIYLRTHNTQTTVPATISISPSATPSVGTVVTITPTTPLLDSTIYDIYYYYSSWWPTDIAGNTATTNYGILATFTTGTAAAVNGVCGSANTGTFTSVAAINPANLCSVGTVSGQTNNGTYSWTCNGNYGGTNASCSATITPANACVAAPSGLVSWWPANDNATDIIGGNNGTLENSATYGVGEVDDGFNLTGNTSSGSDKYIEINGGTMPADLELQSHMTLSAWIYPTAYPVDYGSGAIGIIAGSQHDGNYAGATLYYDARTNPDAGNQGVPPGHIAFNIGNGSTWYVQDTETQVPLNQWTLVTGVGTSGQPSQIYFNGVLQPSNSGNYPENWTGTASYTSTWFQIGQETNENRPFTGLVDEVQVYNTSLSQAQVQAIYNAGNAGVCP